MFSNDGNHRQPPPPPPRSRTFLVHFSTHRLLNCKFYFRKQTALVSIPPSSCARRAAEIFAGKESQLILDLGCGAGRDSLILGGGGATVIGLDAARAGLLLAQKRVHHSQLKTFWVESDSRFLPFPVALFDGVCCFGLLHEFVGQSATADVSRTMHEINRVLKPSGVAIVATAAGEPEKGLPDVQIFSEAMFDAAVREFHCIEKRVYDDLGCTGKQDYKVWFGQLRKK